MFIAMDRFIFPSVSCLSASSQKVSEAFRSAKWSFMCPGIFGELGQNPQKQDFGQTDDINLAYRFVPAVLPDLFPPEIMDYSIIEVSDTTYDLSVKAEDNRSNSSDIEITASIISLWGEALGTICLNPPEDAYGYHNSTITMDAAPGFFLYITASDQSGNRCDPEWLWITKNDLFFDIDNNDVVDCNDLVKWIGFNGKLYQNWLFYLTEEWGRSSGNIPH